MIEAEAGQRVFCGKRILTINLLKG